jgi:hypothetical protein
MGGPKGYGGIQTDKHGVGNTALFAFWTTGGKGEILWLNKEWGFRENGAGCQQGSFDGAKKDSGCSTISRRYYWTQGQEVCG